MKVKKKSRDQRLAEFVARHQPRERPLVKVRKGKGGQRKAAAAAAPPQPPAPSDRLDLSQWDSLDDGPVPPPVEPPAKGRIVGARKAPAATPQIACADCSVRFDPEHPEHKQWGRRDQCGACGRLGERARRVKGEMEWYHKNVPVLRIEGKPDPTTPEEKAKIRRR